MHSTKLRPPLTCSTSHCGYRGQKHTSVSVCFRSTLPPLIYDTLVTGMVQSAIRANTKCKAIQWRSRHSCTAIRRVGIFPWEPALWPHGQRSRHQPRSISRWRLNKCNYLDTVNEIRGYLRNKSWSTVLQYSNLNHRYWVSRKVSREKKRKSCLLQILQFISSNRMDLSI